MKSLGLSRYALAMGAAAALLAGCGGSQPPIVPPGAETQTRTIATRAAHGNSWMLPEAKRENLIYAVGGCGGTCVLSYPKGKLVGAIDGYAADGGGACSDSNGNVYVADNTEVVEFGHGGTTPIATFTLPGDEATGCSVDPASGALAVVYDTNPVAIFPAGSTVPSTYNSLIDALYCGYDDSGNLFVSGYDGQESALSELPADHNTFTQLTLPQTVGQPGQVQWDGLQLTYESRSESKPIVSQLKISGSSATVTGTTHLNKVKDRLAQSWIYNNAIIAPYSVSGSRQLNIGIWKYPQGKVTRQITKFGAYDKHEFDFVGATVSVAPR